MELYSINTNEWHEMRFVLYMTYLYIHKMGDGMTKRHTTLGVIIAIVTIVGIIGPNSIQQALGKRTS
jgi:hypothetical protein